MLYKVYVNLCDFSVGSYVTQGTRAAQSYIYMSLGCCMPNIFAFGLLVLHQKIFKTIPPFGPFLGAGPFVILGTSFEQNEISLSQEYYMPIKKVFWSEVHKKIF